MPEEYDVGYGKPPKETQFRKGQSGNPNGRPKKKKTDQSLKAAVQDMLAGKVPVIMNGKKHQVEVVEALVQRLKKDMLTGTSAECARAVKLLKVICPDYNIPEEFADAPAEVEIKLVESDGFGKEFKPTPEEGCQLKAIWRQHRDGNISLSRIIESIERKLGRPIIDPMHTPSAKPEIRS